MNSIDKYLEFLNSPTDPKDIKNATVDDLDEQINAKKVLEILEEKIYSLFYNPLSSLCIFLSDFRKSPTKLSSFRQSGSLEMEMISV